MAPLPSPLPSPRGEQRKTTANGRAAIAAPPSLAARANREGTNGSEAQCASRPLESGAQKGAESGRVIDSSAAQLWGAVVRHPARCDLSRLRTGVAGRDGDVSPSLGQSGDGERLYKGGRGQADRRHFVVAKEGSFSAREGASASAAKRGRILSRDIVAGGPQSPAVAVATTRILLPASVAVAAPARPTLQGEPAGRGGARLP